MIVRAIEVTHGSERTTVTNGVSTAAASYVSGILDYSVLRGANRRVLLRLCELTPSILETHHTRIPMVQAIRLMRASATLLDDAAFALHFGESVPCYQLVVTAELGAAAKTVREAMMQVNRYSPLGLDLVGVRCGERYRLDTCADGAWFTDTRPSDGWPEITESTFARMAVGMRRLAGRQIVRAVHVTHDAPIHRPEYDRIFGAPIVFGARRNALLIDPAFLAQPLPPAPQHRTSILTAHADQQLDAISRARSCRGRVEDALRVLLPSGDVGVLRVSRELAMSRQTLYRRLQGEGTTYADVLDSLRYDLARTGLLAPDASVRSVARSLGFSESAAFSRAFKRWTGTSPSAFARPLVTSETDHLPHNDTMPALTSLTSP